MYKPKLSIIIPTKNRQKYALDCVKTIVNFKNNDFEIIVQDNSDNNSLETMLDNSIKDSRLKYFYNETCLSFCANFEEAVEHSTGDYICIIGDDDCILPEIIDLTNVLREKDISAAVFPTCYSYYWPQAINNNAGKLVIRIKTGFIKEVNTKSALDNMLNKGNYDYQQYNFPKIYHGIVKREKFDLVKEKTGHYFGGLTPDIYSAVSLSFYIDKYIYINLPFTLPGICATSGSADSLTGRHRGDLADAPHFRGHDNYIWEKDIPYIYSVDTIWSETVFKAIRENGGHVCLTDEQYFNFLVYIIKNNAVFKKELIKLYEERTHTKAIFKFNNALLKLKIRYFLKKGFSFIKQYIRGRYTHKNVIDMESALEIIQQLTLPYNRLLNQIKSINSKEEIYENAE